MAPAPTPVLITPPPDDLARVPRTFQCRNGLWRDMEHLSRVLECSVDYLMNEAMKRYLRQHEHHLTSSSPLPHPTAPVVPAPPVSPAPTAPVSPAVVSPRGRLVVIYNDQRYPVDEARFLIGRGKKDTHLMIADGNVSRHHAVIEWLEGQFFIADLNSTNGIVFQGLRIARKQICNGDLFTICGHPLRCLYEA